jgi:putative spermidine/putrescine transport system substrate-binding protein
MSAVVYRACLLLILLGLLVACSGTPTPAADTGGSATESSPSDGSMSDTVISYNSPEQWANWGEVLNAFTTKTGIAAPSDPKNSGQTIAALEAEAAAPQADTAYYGIVFGIEATEKGLVEPYQPAGFADIPDALKEPSGAWMTVHQGTIAFLVNTDELDGAPVPQCWADLQKPEYANKVGMLDPTQAAVGYSVLTAANLALGGSLENFDPGIAYFAELAGQGLILPAQTATAMVQQGEIPILIDADFNGYQLKHRDNAPIEVVIPCEGTLSIPYVMSLVKGAPHADAGKALLEFVLSDEGQQLFAASYLRPVRNVEVDPAIAEGMVPASEYERVISPDFAQMRAVQAEVVERWSTEVAP